MAPPVLAAQYWSSNGHMVADLARLGYLKKSDRTLDPTRGTKGSGWWGVWCPDSLICHDKVLDGTDFRKLPYPDCSFDAIAFDPPYVATGGRATTTRPDFADRYGLVTAPKRPPELQELINEGLTEMHRLIRPGKYVLCKCADYVSGGRLWPGTYLTTKHGLELGLELVDRFEYLVKQPRPQPRQGQVHARRNLSTLLVFRRRYDDQRQSEKLFV